MSCNHDQGQVIPSLSLLRDWKEGEVIGNIIAFYLYWMYLFLKIVIIQS